jgi:hypothetical protein
VLHAPTGWHRNLFEPRLEEHGGSWFRPKDAYANECTLALAFESRADLADEVEGYVRFATVVKHFRIQYPELLGFCSDVRCGITPEILDVVWERQLRIGNNFLYRTRDYTPVQRALAKKFPFPDHHREFLRMLGA